jgi:hypothetical protein
MPPLLLDILLSLAVALGFTEFLIRAFRMRGPWKPRWSLWLVVFLAAWGGGVWLGPSSMQAMGWLGYCLPFVLVGLAAAFVIALVSPRRALSTPSDREAFEREEQAVGMGVVVFFWSLCALLLAVIVHGYWFR